MSHSKFEVLRNEESLDKRFFQLKDLYIKQEDKAVHEDK